MRRHSIARLSSQILLTGDDLILRRPSAKANRGSALLSVIRRTFLRHYPATDLEMLPITVRGDGNHPRQRLRGRSRSPSSGRHLVVPPRCGCAEHRRSHHNQRQRCSDALLCCHIGNPNSVCPGVVAGGHRKRPHPLRYRTRTRYARRPPSMELRRNARRGDPHPHTFKPHTPRSSASAPAYGRTTPPPN